MTPVGIDAVDQAGENILGASLADEERSAALLERLAQISQTFQTESGTVGCQFVRAVARFTPVSWVEHVQRDDIGGPGDGSSQHWIVRDAKVVTEPDHGSLDGLSVHTRLQGW